MIRAISFMIRKKMSMCALRANPLFFSAKILIRISGSGNIGEKIAKIVRSKRNAQKQKMGYVL